MVHHIHIPVMGICYTADTPVRVGHFGITSVISLVDDGLLEEYRHAYGERLGIDVGALAKSRVDRIRLYLDFVADQVARKFEHLCNMRIARCVGGGAVPCSGATCAELNDKDRYFLMLPRESPLRMEYEQVCEKSGLARVAAEAALTEKMEPGEIQANIMVSLNYRDAALDAVRGFAQSKVKGALVFSAGVNLGVFEEVAKWGEFFRYSKGNGSSGEVSQSVAPKKKIILKVSDYRSALIQGRYLAKNGLEVYEYRIESGVNCGGHAFFEGKKLLPDVLKEFISKKQELFETTSAMIEKFGNRLYESGGSSEKSARIVPPGKPSRVSAQGGLCTAGEIEQVLAMGADGVGVGTPFLLVPQATSLDAGTRALLAGATLSDVSLSHGSPLGVPFMNLRTSSAAILCRKKADQYFLSRQSDASCHGEESSSKSRDCLERNPLQSSPEVQGISQDASPGFPCVQHYLCRNIPGFDHPVCMASREYVKYRLSEIDNEEKAELAAVSSEGELSGKSLSEEIRKKYDRLRCEALERECICRFLGNAGREEIREKSPSCNYESEKLAVARGLRKLLLREPVTVCPGPDIAFFDREYTLLEMMEHLYGTGPCLTPDHKPSAFDLERKILEGNAGV